MKDMTENDSRGLVDNVLYKPYKVAARGPDKFDCWGLVHYIYSNYLKIELPTFAGGHIARKDLPSMIELNASSVKWLKLDEPENFCIVVLGKNTIKNHIGIWIDDFNGVCLHSTAETGVVGHTLENLKRQGFNIIEFYRWQE